LPPRHVVVAADAVAGSRRAGHAGRLTQLDAQRAAEAVVGFDDARLDQHLAHRDVDLGDQRLDLFQLAGMSVTKSWLVRVS
jgi:hypothetical protein